jgi:hypothetical protein
MPKKETKEQKTSNQVLKVVDSFELWLERQTVKTIKAKPGYSSGGEEEAEGSAHP